MPRSKCSQCGAPLDGVFFHPDCEYCGAKAVVSFSLRAAWDLLAPFALVGVWVFFANHGRKFDPSVILLELFFGLAAAVVAFMYRRANKLHDPSLIVDFLKPAGESKPPPIRQFPHEPVFDVPRSWKSIVTAPRPRSVRLSSRGKRLLLLGPAMIAFVVAAGISLPRQNSLPVVYLVFAGVIAWFFYAAVKAIGREITARRLMRDGELTIGWVTDCRETGGRHKNINITVEFRDLVGRLFARDFVVHETDDSIDPGHAILVFYEAINPEKNAVACATMFKLADV
jgi:hypothetical protein